MIFDIALSIGMDCQCRYNISRTLYIQANGNDDQFFIGRNRKNVVDYGSFFFDWNRTPIRSAISILSSRFEGVLELPNLHINELPNGNQTVIDKETGCSYRHIFSKTQSGTCTSNDIYKEYEAIKQKYDYVKKKTLDVLTSEKNILFVLTGNHPHYDVLELCDVLSEFTENYMLLYTPWKNKYGYKKQSLLDQDLRIIISPILHAPYPGDFKSWDHAFKDIHLKTPNHQTYG